MKQKTNTFLIYSLMALVAVVVGCVCSVNGQDESVALRELRAALSLAQNQALNATNSAAASEAQRKELVKSLAEAVRVSEEQVVLSRDIQLKLQAFGVDLFTMEENSLERRLLKAVRDLDIAHQEKELQAKAIESLGGAFARYLNVTEGTVSDDVTAKAVDAIKVSRKAVLLAHDTEKSGNNGKSELDNSKVVSIDSEIGLLVLNAGRSDGIKVGTPVAVLRGERKIFTAMIVDVRDSICGAVLQNRLVENDGVKVGDGIRILASGSN